MRIVIDACVLYPTVMREVVLGAAEAGLFAPRWSARILEEWARAARKIGPEGETIARGEIAAVQARCRFGNCTHTHEPGCAVVHAVEAGDIAWTRYASYLAIYEDIPEYYTE